VSSAPNYTPLIRRLRLFDAPLEREAAAAIQWLQRRCELLEADKRALAVELLRSAETIRKIHEETR